MEIYTLDSAWSKNSVIEQIISLTWKEQYQDFGEFVLKVVPTASNIASLTVGVSIIHSKTNTPMIIESAVLEDDDEGRAVLSLGGRTLLLYLSYRTDGALTTNFISSQYNTTPEQYVLDSIDFQMGTQVKGANYDGKYGVPGSPEDKIPNLLLYTAITGSPTQFWLGKAGNLWENIGKILNPLNRGQRIFVRTASPRLVYEIYQGANRPQLLFSKANDSLTGISQAYSVQDLVTRVDVLRKNNVMTFYYAPGYGNADGSGAATGMTGLLSRSGFLDWTSVDPASYRSNADYLVAEKAAAMAYLNDHNKVDLYDGQIPPVSPYTYGVDYNMGDIGYIVDRTGTKKQVRITEYIWSYDDATGETSYPGLTRV